MRQLIFLQAVLLIFAAAAFSQNWTKQALTGTAISVESPQPFKLVQDKPDPFIEGETARIMWSLSHAGVFSTITYEKNTREKKTPRQAIEYTAKLFAEMNKPTMSRITDTTILGRPAVLFEEEFFEPYAKKNTHRRMIVFGAPGELTTINISYPTDDANAKAIADRIYASVKGEGSVAAETSRMPPVNWTRAQLRGLNYETPNPTPGGPNCRERTLPNLGFKRTAVCYEWGNAFNINVVHRQYATASAVPSPSLVAHTTVSALKGLDKESTLNANRTYEVKPFAISGAEAAKLEQYLGVGTVGSRTDTIYIRRGGDFWEVTVGYSTRWEYEKETAARIIASLNFQAAPAALPKPPSRSSAALIEAGRALAAANDNSGALAQYSAAIAADPGNGLAYFYRGVTRSKLGDNDGAIADYTEAIRLNTSLGVAYFNRGTLRYNKKDYAGAVADLTRAVEIDPKYVHAYFNRGLAYFSSGDKDRAAADFTTVISLDPKYAGAYVMRAQIYCSIGLTISAIKDEDKAIALGRALDKRCGRSQ